MGFGVPCPNIVFVDGLCFSGKGIETSVTFTLTPVMEIHFYIFKFKTDIISYESGTTLFNPDTGHVC